MRTVTRAFLVTAAAVLLAISIHQVALAVSLDKCQPTWAEAEKHGWIAWDGQTLNDQSYRVRVMFYGEWGEVAAGRWRWEHNCKTRPEVDTPQVRSDARDATTTERQRPENQPDPTPRGIFGDAPYTVFDVEHACWEVRDRRPEPRAQPSDSRFTYSSGGIYDAKTGAGLMGCE